MAGTVTSDENPQSPAAQVSKQIMTAVGLIDELRVIALWLGQHKSSPLTTEYMNHLRVTPGEFQELRQTYAALVRTFAEQQP